MSREELGRVSMPVAAESAAAGSAGPASASAAPAFSFVMPVYNAATSVGASIESVLGQTEDDLELICVDDGSTDGTARALADYAARDPRVRVISQANAGPSAARNAGLDAARGAIICTLDADDALVPTYCARLRAVFEGSGAEVVVFGASCEPEDAASARIRGLLSPAATTYEPREHFDPALLFRANAQPYAWRAAMTRGLEEREHVRFPEAVHLGEDVAFLFTLYPVARRVELIPDKLYRYRMVEGSITHGLDALDALERKVGEHLAAFDAILAAWRVRGLGALCPAEMVTWCLDLTVFDLVRLERPAAARAAERLAGLLAGTYGPAWCECPRSAAVRSVARAVAEAAAAGAPLELGKLGVMRFFLATRGLKACVERLLR